MGKMRNYTYGSPKFEGEINKAISEAGGDVKIYQHKISIQATDSNSEYCYGTYIIYNTNPTPLFDMYTIPSIEDVKTVIQSTCTGNTPDIYVNGKFYNMYIHVLEGTLMSMATDVATGTNTVREVSSIFKANDTVKEM